MTIDCRGRRGGAGLPPCVDDLGSSEPDRGSIERFERVRVASSGTGGSAPASSRRPWRSSPSCSWHGPSDLWRGATPAAPRGGLILYGEWDASAQRADWYTVSTGRIGPETSTSSRHARSGSRTGADPGHERRRDGTGAAAPSRRSSIPTAPTCAAWTRREPGSESRVRRRVAGRDRIALEGFGQDGHPSSTASTRSTRRTAAHSSGSSRAGLAPQVLAGRHPAELLRHEGSVSPTGSGALFVMRADGSADPVASRRGASRSATTRGRPTERGSCSRGRTDSSISCTPMGPASTGSRSAPAGPAR